MKYILNNFFNLILTLFKKLRKINLYESVNIILNQGILIKLYFSYSISFVIFFSFLLENFINLEIDNLFFSKIWIHLFLLFWTLISCYFFIPSYFIFLSLVFSLLNCFLYNFFKYLKNIKFFNIFMEFNFYLSYILISLIFSKLIIFFILIFIFGIRNYFLNIEILSLEQQKDVYEFLIYTVNNKLNFIDFRLRGKEISRGFLNNILLGPKLELVLSLEEPFDLVKFSLITKEIIRNILPLVVKFILDNHYFLLNILYYLFIFLITSLFFRKVFINFKYIKKIIKDFLKNLKKSLDF